MRDTNVLARNLAPVQIGALVFAAVGIVLGLIGGVTDLDHFFQIYFMAFLFWLQASLGCLAAVMLVNIVTSPWSLSIRRVAEAGARTLPLMAVLFIPLLLGLDRIFPWAAADAAYEGNKAAYYETGFVVVRSIIYLTIWTLLAYVLPYWSYRHDDTADPVLMQRSYVVSIVGMLVFFLTTTFAAFDWVMSIEKGWFSSVIGWLFVSQQVLMALPLMFIVLMWLAERSPLSRIVSERVQIDLSALMLVALMAWMYLSYMQFVVIWSGNLSDKVSWFAIRSVGAWNVFVVVMVAGHALAFLTLVTPGLKRIRPLMLSVAGLLLVLRVVDIYWVIMPSYTGEFAPRWWDLTLLIGFGGAWVALFVWSLTRQALVPINHPELEQAMIPQDTVEVAV